VRCLPIVACRACACLSPGSREPPNHPIEPRLRRNPWEINVEQSHLVRGYSPDELHEFVRCGAAVNPTGTRWIQQSSLPLACPGGVVLDIPDSRPPGTGFGERLMDAVDVPVADNRQESRVERRRAHEVSCADGLGRAVHAYVFTREQVAPPAAVAVEHDRVILHPEMEIRLLPQGDLHANPVRRKHLGIPLIERLVVTHNRGSGIPTLVGPFGDEILLRFGIDLGARVNTSLCQARVLDDPDVERPWEGRFHHRIAVTHEEIGQHGPAVLEDRDDGFHRSALARRGTEQDGTMVHSRRVITRKTGY